MKTYIFDTFNRYKRFSEELDAKTILCNKSWWVFNDNGDKEVYIFQTDGSLIISIKGKVSYSTWKYITANQSIIITSGEQAYMVKPAFVDGNILALQVDGTDEYAFLIDEQKFKELVFKTYNDILEYFVEKERYNLSLQKTQVQIDPNENTKEEKEVESDSALFGMIVVGFILSMGIAYFIMVAF
jgi:hypothetical protein